MPVSVKNRFRPLMKMRSFSQPLSVEENNNKKRRLYFGEDTRAQRYIVVKKVDCDQSFRGVSPFLIQKGLSMITEDIKETQRLRSGDLLILTSKEAGAKALLKATKLADLPINVEEHKYLNSSKGVIYSYDLMYVDTKEIEKELESQNVTKVERIKRKINGELKDTPLHILTINATELPNDIKAGFLKLNVRPYIPNPMRCHNCQRYGHTKTKCFRVPICPKCSNQIPKGHEEMPCEPIKCANCLQDHTTFDQKCPMYLMEKEIIKIKTMDRITYIRAKEQYFRENSNTTGATATMTIAQTRKTYSEIVQNNTETEQPVNDSNNNNKNNNYNNNKIDNNNNNNKQNNNNNNNKNNDENSTNNNNKQKIENNKNKNNNNNNTINNTNRINFTQTEIEKTKDNEVKTTNNELKSSSTKPDHQTAVAAAKKAVEESENLRARKYTFLNPAELNIALDTSMDSS